MYASSLVVIFAEGRRQAGRSEQRWERKRAANRWSGSASSVCSRSRETEPFAALKSVWIQTLFKIPRQRKQKDGTLCLFTVAASGTNEILTLVKMSNMEKSNTTQMIGGSAETHFSVNWWGTLHSSWAPSTIVLSLFLFLRGGVRIEDDLVLAKVLKQKLVFQPVCPPLGTEVHRWRV